MHWLTFLFPRTIVRTSSPYNRDICVIEDRMRYKLLVNGIHESSDYIAGFWQVALDGLQVKKLPAVQDVLVLGVAGGTVIHMLHHFFPNASMHGVDIDATMIRLGKTYFGLDTIKNLTFSVADAEVYVQKQKPASYTLIVLDLYIARHIPSFIADMKFLARVKRLLRPGGALLINYLRDGDYETKAVHLEKNLQKIYTRVSHIDHLNNRFFLAR